MDKELVTKFFNDPDFHKITDLLSEKTHGLRDIGTLDLSESAETIKARVAGRQETIKIIDNFILEIEQSKKVTNNNPSTFK